MPVPSRLPSRMSPAGRRTGRRVALVAQRPALYPHLTVRRNLSASVDFRQNRGLFGWFRATSKSDFVTSAELAARVAEAAQILGLTPLLDRQPRHLSGGEQQRVALGRAWVARAAVWLLDEPLVHLDSRLRSEIRASCTCCATGRGRQ